MQKAAIVLFFLVYGLSVVLGCIEFNTKTHVCERKKYECICEPREKCKSNEEMVCKMAKEASIENIHSLFSTNVMCYCQIPCKPNTGYSDFCGYTVCNSKGEWEYTLFGKRAHFKPSSGADEVCDPEKEVVYFYSIYTVNKLSDCASDDSKCILKYCQDGGEGCRIGDGLYL